METLSRTYAANPQPVKLDSLPMISQINVLEFVQLYKRRTVNPQREDVSRNALKENLPTTPPEDVKQLAMPLQNFSKTHQPTDASKIVP